MATKATKKNPTGITRCAIYARKSTKQADVSDEQKSVERQIENARAFAAARKWIVLENHIYKDDGKSGASSLARLPDKARMLDAITATKKPPFEALIIQGPDRLSRRDGDEAFTELKGITKAGVEVWFYSDATKFEYGTLQSNTVGFLKGEFAAEFRRDIARKTAEAMTRKAHRGVVTGGSCFGYDNYCSACGRDIPAGASRCCKKADTLRRRNVVEAAIVQRIFELSAAGDGLTRITKTLNEEGAATPRPQQDRPRGWTNSTVREVLRRTAYKGVITYGQTKKRDLTGDVAPHDRDPAEWLTISAEHLRIVSDELWTAVHQRLGGGRRTLTLVRTNEPIDIRTRDVESKHLLSGFAKCGHCGGALSAVTRAHGSGQQRFRVPFYGCYNNWKRGHRVCANALVLRTDVVDHAVLNELAKGGLAQVVIRGLIDAVYDSLQPAQVAASVESRKAELRALDAKIREPRESGRTGGRGSGPYQPASGTSA